MTSTQKIFGALLAATFAASLSGCAANLCERKDSWFKSHCAGSDVSYSNDGTCSAMIDRCDQGHLAQLAGYVQCLEAQNMCSMDIIASCGQQFPGGVNLSCSGNP